MSTHKRLLLGCIADDFTGAGDAASFLQDGGLKTLLVIWPHVERVSPESYDAVVVALKSRSIPPEDAIRESLAALDWLKTQGAQKLYFKYCSTFDSTPRGNIGPVCDAILEHYGIPCTVLCPSLLSNGRSVRGGTLFVNGVPLAESHMSRHPLNPMWSSSIKALMQAQSKYPCFEICADEYSDAGSLARNIKVISADNQHFYLVPEYYEPAHAEAILTLFGELPFLTGGSGLLGSFAQNMSRLGSHASGRQSSCCSAIAGNTGRLMLAGSCSDMTRRQVRRWIECGGRAVMVSAEDALTGAPRAAELADIFLSAPDRDILYYSSGSDGSAQTDISDKAVSSAMESCLAAIACAVLSKVPVTRLISAGGETSGAITTALGLGSFAIGNSIAPGVPVLIPNDKPELQLVLKSGNFGNERFFIDVLKGDAGNES